MTDGPSSSSSAAASSRRLVVLAVAAAALAATAHAFVVPTVARPRVATMARRTRAAPPEGPSSSSSSAAASLIRPRASSLALAAEGKGSSGGKEAAGSKKSGGGGSGGSGGASKGTSSHRGRRAEQMDMMNMGPRFEMGYDIEPEVVPLEEDDTLPWVETIAAAADARKGKEVYAIRVSSLTTVSSFFVLVSGNSRPQIQAIAAAIEEDMQEKHGVEPRNGGEGTADSGWILLDFGSVVVNIMTPVARQYYALEKLWRKGEEVDLSHILKPNLPPGAAAAAGVEAGEALPASTMQDGMDKENDPFWS